MNQNYSKSNTEVKQSCNPLCSCPAEKGDTQPLSALFLDKVGTNNLLLSFNYPG